MMQILSHEEFEEALRRIPSGGAISRLRDHDAALRSTLAAARYEVRQQLDWRTDLGNAVLANAGDEFDGDEDQDLIAVRYVRYLEGTDGVRRIRQERLEQLAVWDAEHDDIEHGIDGRGVGDLVAAARCYALFAWWQVNTTDAARAAQLSCGWTREMVDDILLGSREGDDPLEHPGWPWDESAWKPSDDPLHNLAKAGALIAAEIDRLLRERDAARVRRASVPNGEQW